MTATERLRELLDARGVQVVDNVFGITWDYYSDPHTATDSLDGTRTLIVSGLTPEQAIAATLGAGECEMEYGGDITPDTAKAMGVYFCSECGSPIYNDCMPYFCGYCGKAVKR